MKKIFEMIGSEWKGLGVVSFALLVGVWAGFFRESPLVIIRTTLALLLMFLLPGYILLLSFKEKLGFLERVSIGFALMGCIYGILSYYLGLLGLHVKFHVILLPLIAIGAGILLVLRKRE